MAKTKDPYLEKILPPVVGAVVGGITGALVTGLVFYLIPSAFGLRHEVSINEFVTAVNQSLKPQLDELKTNVGNNIIGESTKLGNRVAALEAKLEAIDNYLVEELRAKAAKILGTSNVAIVRTNATGLTSSPTALWAPYKGSKEQNVYAIYTVEEIKEDFLVVRSTIKQSDGKVLDDKPIKMRLPSDVGKPVTYSPRLKGMGASPASFQLVLLERLSPTDLILATGIKSPSTS